MERDTRVFQLPFSIVSPTDIARLTREMESLDNYFRQQEIRSSGTPNTPPRLSKLMDQLAADNQMNLLSEVDRQKLTKALQQLHHSAPVMHISFSIDPPGPYVQKIVEWLRRNIHQYVLVTVGLQPNIGAGCVVRTTNKMFDFSLREFFAQKRGFFIEKLHDALVSEPVIPATTATVTDTPVAATVPAQPIAASTAPQPERQAA